MLMETGPQQIRGCCTSFTYITNEIASYKGHFGPDEHDYSHWMALELPHGSYALRVLLFIRPEAASKARRDATPLRLISWLSYKLNPELEQFIEKAMEHLSTWTETEGGKVLTMGKEAIPQGETINSEVELRDQLIDLISVGNLKHKPKALFTLFRQFLTRISLPRLIHFMDLVLPQLTPVQAAWHELVGLSQRVLFLALTGVVMMHCGFYVSSRTGSCIPLPDKHQLCYW